jgi:hypothetical protein
MDRTKQMEIIHEGLETLKKNQNVYSQAKETAKQILGKHPEISKDKDLTGLILYAAGLIGKDLVEEVVEGYFKPKPKKFELLEEGTTKSEKTENMDFLFLMLFAKIQTAALAHKVHVLTRTDIRKDVEFPNDEPDDEGKMPKHRTMSVSLWDTDLKKIISLFLVDEQVDLHAKLEQGKAYRMQIGNYNAEKNRWYASKDPQIVALDDFTLDEEELAKYLVQNYSPVKRPYEDVIADEKAHPGKRYVLHAKYVKMPMYISLLTEEGDSVMLAYSKLTSSTLDENGEAVILGTFQKSKPAEGQPQLTDYIIFPDVVINLNAKDDGKNPQQSSEENGEAEQEDLDKILG